MQDCTYLGIVDCNIIVSQSFWIPVDIEKLSKQHHDLISAGKDAFENYGRVEMVF